MSGEDLYRKENMKKPEIKQSGNLYVNQIKIENEKDNNLKKAITVFFIVSFAISITINIWQSFANDEAYKITMDSLERLKKETEKSRLKDQQLKRQSDKELEQYKKINNLEKMIEYKDSLNLITIRKLQETIKKFNFEKAKLEADFKKDYASYTR
ncbi:MAG TPA: hypothetical protein PLZ05_02785 [Alphaproteobacteria bacterium]|nr:hypothetical protein [Alphaproteobacteria bacterium]